MAETQYPAAASGGYTKFARIIDSKTSGTAAQTVPAFAGSWTAMEFTSIQENDDSIISGLSSNQFTITGVTEFLLNLWFAKNITGASAKYNVPRVRLYDVTAGAVYQSHIHPKVLSASWYFNDAAAAPYLSLEASFRVKKSTTNQYRIEIAMQSSIDLGAAQSLSSTNEIYKVLDIWGK